MIVSKEIQIAMAHRLMEHSGDCRHLHGHTWKISASIEGGVNPDDGMVVDFAQLKEHLEAVIGFLDHSVLLYVNDPLVAVLIMQRVKVWFMSHHPTSENLARYAFRKLHEHGYDVEEVTVQESPTSSTTCRRQDSPPPLSMYIALGGE